MIQEVSIDSPDSTTVTATCDIYQTFLTLSYEQQYHIKLLHEEILELSKQYTTVDAVGNTQFYTNVENIGLIDTELICVFDETTVRLNRGNKITLTHTGFEQLVVLITVCKHYIDRITL
jgi:hypothetical protein